MVGLDERPKVRWGFLVACGCAVVVIGFLIIGAIVLTANRAIDETLGPKLSKADRNEITHTNCAQLAKLYARYVPNGDSEEPDATGLRLTIDRQHKLGCEPGWGNLNPPST